MLPHILLVSLVVSCIASFVEAGQRVMDLFMPEVRPDSNEMYLCLGVRLLPNEEYIVGFEPYLSTNFTHHMVLSGCSEPGVEFDDEESEKLWDCTPGGNTIRKRSSLSWGPTCADGYGRFLFGCANNGLDPVDLPSGVGFRVGGNSGIRYLVLNVHYKDVSAFEKDAYLTDSSGVTLQMVSGKAAKHITKSAGILYNDAGNPGVPPGLSRRTIECALDEDKVIHPFRFRVHTHNLGYNVAGFKRSKNDLTKFTMVGQRNPQLAQSYVPVVSNSSLTLSRGDRFYTYCDYNNDQGKTVSIGPSSFNEMCVFYLMYWVEGKDVLENEACDG